MNKTIALLACLVGLASLLGLASSARNSLTNTLFNRGEDCFCQLKGTIDDCQCNIDTVDYFNNKKIYPRLQSLIRKNYFKYFQYNTNKKCPFWDMSLDKCNSLSCGVQSCTQDDLPPGLQGFKEKDCHDDLVDDTLSDFAIENLKSWKDHDELKTDFCDVHAETCIDCEFIDLTINPERYTGYAGEPSLRIWRAIYEENCFKPQDHDKPTGSYFVQDNVETMCLEKRAFYKAVSGLHSSITIHLTSMYALSKMSPEAREKAQPFVQDSQKPQTPFSKTVVETYGPNMEEFLKRFDPDLTNNQGPYWLKNLYFVYLLELRALTKAAPFFENHSFYTGSTEDDIETSIAVKELLSLFKTFPDHFDESFMFAGGSQADQLKAEFRDHFRNITSIMDCVGCEKCKLWGKLQTTGLGTALKVLITEDIKNLTLTRNEVVAFFNAFGRISTSIFQLERFREMIKLHSGKEEL